MSLLTKTIGLDPVIKAIKERNPQKALDALVALLTRYAGADVAGLLRELLGPR